MPPEERSEYEARRREAFKQRDRTELIDELHSAGLGSEAIVAPAERFDHPQLRETGGVVQVDDPEIGPTTQLGVMIFLESTPGAVKGAQPVAGAHTGEVLASLGYDETEVATLRARGVI
jgi:crotonobetainyl-CoA:carnitine CoA-transferase CaiB-like acyl-CoA transferase